MLDIAFARASMTEAACFVEIHFWARSSLNYSLDSGDACWYFCQSSRMAWPTLFIFLLDHSMFSDSKSLWTLSRSSSPCATAETKYSVIGIEAVRINGARLA